MSKRKRQLRRRKSLGNDKPEKREDKDDSSSYSPTKKPVSANKSVAALASRPCSLEKYFVSTMWTNKVALVVTIASALWSLSYILLGGTSKGKARFTKIASHVFKDAKGGAPIVMLAMPILISGCACMLLLLRPQTATPSKAQRRHQIPGCIQRIIQNYQTGHGDWNFNTFAIAFILFPCTMFLLGCIYRHLHGKELDADDVIMEISNSFGFMAVVALSFFLIPVARHSPILNALKWGHAHALVLHIWSGRIIFVAAAMHGVMHMYRWVRNHGEGLLAMLFPPVPCYKRNTDYEPTCVDPDTDCSCYHLLRNMTGFLALVALVVIGATSLNYVRRKFYKVFYISHVIAGPIMILTTILHYNRSVLFLSPSLLYYIASSVPVMVESWRKCRKDRGVRILSVKSLFDSSSQSQQRPCVSVTFEASDAAVESYSPAQYVKVLAPSVSSIYHPFTINTVPGKPNQVRLIFRVMGPFTSDLADQLLQTDENVSLPIVHLDGYHGAPNRVDQVLSHDVAVLVAGGIGITPLLSMLHEVHSILSVQQDAVTRKVVLHWMCRETSLVHYITKEYFDPLLQQAASSGNKFQIRIVVHKTLAMQTSTSYSDLESPKQSEDDVAENDEIASGSDGIIGVPFTPSRFSAGSRTRLVSNLLPFVGFASIAWVGLAAVWYLYKNVQEKSAVASRGWSVVALAVIGVVCSVAINFLMDVIDTDGRVSYSVVPSNSTQRQSTWLKRTTASMSETGDIANGGESSEEEIEMENVKDDVTPGDSRFGVGDNTKDSLSKTGVTVEEMKGRPTVHELLKSLDGATCPGLFSCGPTNLMAELRIAADDRCAMRIQHCIRGTPHISVYEEAFEM